MMKRGCIRSGCTQAAVATLTFVYADSMAVLGPLAIKAQPGCYDLCAKHAKTTSAPMGWRIVKLTDPGLPEPLPDADDLESLADLVRRIGFGDDQENQMNFRASDNANIVELGSRGHLRVIADADSFDRSSEPLS